MPCLLVVPEFLAPNDIALASEGREVITSTVRLFHLGIKAPAVVRMLDHEFISSIYSLSDGATFSGNRVAGPLEYGLQRKRSPQLGKDTVLPTCGQGLIARNAFDLSHDRNTC